METRQKQPKEDMMKAYEEIKEMQAEEGKEVPELEFSYKYDMQSFFQLFLIPECHQGCGVGRHQRFIDEAIHFRCDSSRTKAIR